MSDDLKSTRQIMLDTHVLLKEHIAKYQERDKVLTAIADVVWDSKKEPGLATRVDRLVQNEIKQTWQRKAIATALIAIIGERAAHFLIK